MPVPVVLIIYEVLLDAAPVPAGYVTELVPEPPELVVAYVLVAPTSAPVSVPDAGALVVAASYLWLFYGSVVT